MTISNGRRTTAACRAGPRERPVVQLCAERWSETSKRRYTDARLRAGGRSGFAPTSISGSDGKHGVENHYTLHVPWKTL
ncbi:MAG: hypothetical protein ACREPY_13015 [Rhodanobacteraceae bacterium]